MKRKRILMAVFLAIPVLIGAILSIGAATDPYDCRILEGVSTGGLDMGGMTPWEACGALTDALEASLLSQPLTVELPGETLVLMPKDSGVKVQTLKIIRDAWAVGRQEPATAPEQSLLPYLKLNREKICQILAEYADRRDTDLVQPSWKLCGPLPALGTDAFDPEAPGQILVVTMGVPKVRMDVQQVYEEIFAAYGNAISACLAGSFSVTPEITPEILPEAPDLAAIAREVSLPPVDDSLDMTGYTLVHGAYGYGFDTEAVQALVDSAAFGETLEIPLTATRPEIFGEGVYFRDVLGSFETKHSTDENRNTNLRLLCAALDGHILEPGQEFSYNEVVGERTEERGYKAATAYSGKQKILDIGGGVCQGSTTLYNCALLADAEIIQRVCHGAAVSYVPLGLDAAVNWNTKTDFKFRNNFHFPMMIKAEVSGGYLKMQLLGTDEKDYYVKMEAKGGLSTDISRAVSYKCKYDKATGELLSREVEAYSTYYPLD